MSSSGLGWTRGKQSAKSTMKSRANRVFYFSSLSKGYWDSYKKGSMLGKCYKAATSISNGILNPLKLQSVLNGNCE